MKNVIRKELKEAQSVLENFLNDKNIRKIEDAAKLLKQTIDQNNKIFH